MLKVGEKGGGNKLKGNSGLEYYRSFSLFYFSASCVCGSGGGGIEGGRRRITEKFQNQQQSIFITMINHDLKKKKKKKTSQRLGCICPFQQPPQRYAQGMIMHSSSHPRHNNTQTHIYTTPPSFCIKLLFDRQPARKI